MPGRRCTGLLRAHQGYADRRSSLTWALSQIRLLDRREAASGPLSRGRPLRNSDAVASGSLSLRERGQSLSPRKRGVRGYALSWRHCGATLRICTPSPPPSPHGRGSCSSPLQAFSLELLMMKTAIPEAAGTKQAALDCFAALAMTTGHYFAEVSRGRGSFPRSWRLLRFNCDGRWQRFARVDRDKVRGGVLFLRHAGSTPIVHTSSPPPSPHGDLCEKPPHPVLFRLARPHRIVIASFTPAFGPTLLDERMASQPSLRTRHQPGEAIHQPAQCVSVDCLVPSLSRGSSQ